MRIEKNIPLPKESKQLHVQMISTMLVGDCFVIDSYESTANNSVCGYARMHGRRKGKKFTSRHDGKQIRIWRTA